MRAWACSRRNPCVVERIERRAQRFVVTAAVVDHTRGGGVRKLVVPDVVPTRTSAESRFSRRAISSTVRSRLKNADVRATPRYGPSGVLLVATA